MRRNLCLERLWPAIAAFPVLLLGSLIALPGCIALQELAALRSVTFSFSHCSDVRLAGIAVGPGSSFSRLSVNDAARLTSAVLSKQVPIDLVVHVSATNPAENKVNARLVGLAWKLFIEDRQAVKGDLATPVAIAPGSTSDVPLAMTFDLFDLGSGGARDLFDVAAGIAGVGSTTKDLRLEMSPTVSTSLGPIRYPSPIVVRRQTSPR